MNASLQFLADKTKKNELNAYEFHFFFKFFSAILQSTSVYCYTFLRLLNCLHCYTVMFIKTILGEMSGKK